MSPINESGPRDRIAPAVRAGLVGPNVRLEPMNPAHAEDLAQHCGGSDTFAHFSKLPDGIGPTSCTLDGMLAWIDTCRHDVSRIGYAIIIEQPVGDLTAGTAVGSTSFLDIRPEDRGVEIGYTWIAPGCRGSWVNPAVKLALLSAAFEHPMFVGPNGGETAMRVALKTDATNTRSRAAIEKLSAVFEGILRRHMLMPDGRWRDSAYYSVVEDEWPNVRGRLRERLGTVDGSPDLSAGD